MQAAIDSNMIDLAHKLADVAGDVLRRHHRVPVAVDLKADASPVTQADREAETVMRKLIEDTYPGHGIVGEEYGNARDISAHQWVLDPIDGTKAFIAGFPTFTTLIALANAGRLQIGIIDQPILRERWLGLAGQPTTLNGKPVKTRDCKKLEQAVIGTTSIDVFTPKQAQVFAHMRAPCGNVALGGDAYAYAMLATGRIDLLVDAGFKPYDFCALKTVVEGAGGVITDWYGEPLTLASDGSVLAAATPTLHALALARLQAAA